MKLQTVEFYPDSGDSFAAIKHLGSTFIGEAKLHPEDKDKVSEYMGCGIAETRAEINALRYEHKLAKHETEIIRKFIHCCKCHKTWDNDSPTAKAMYHQLNVRIKKVNRLADEINLLIVNLKSKINKRDKYLKMLEMAKQKRLKGKEEK